MSEGEKIIKTHKELMVRKEKGEQSLHFILEWMANRLDFLQFSYNMISEQTEKNRKKLLSVEKRIRKLEGKKK